MLRKKGSGRIGKVIDRVKNDIVELDKGIDEVDDEIHTNNGIVDYQRKSLEALEVSIADKNATLQTSKEMASSVKGALEKLLGV